MLSNIRFTRVLVSRALGISVLVAILFVAGCTTTAKIAQFGVSTTSGQLPAAVINSAYPQTTLTAANGTAPYMWAWSGNTPPGMSLGTAGVLTGTPTSFGTFNFTVTVTDSATPTPHTATASLTVMINPAVSSVAVNPATLTGGTASTGTVTLNGAAAAAATVTLASSSASATVPATATVAAGATTGTFQVSTSAVASTTPATITATYGVAKTAVLTVNAPTVASPLTLAQSTVTGGTSTTGTVTLTGPAATGGDTVTLSSDNAAAQVPASVSVLAGQTSAQFTVTTTAGGNVTAHIMAAFNSSSQTANLIVVPAPTITSFTSAAATITAGGSTTLTGVFSNGTGSVSNGVGAVTNSIAVSVSPATTTTYTLTVTNAAGTAVTKQVIVTVVAAPVITSFVPGAATITSGSSTTLTAMFSNGTGSVDNSVGVVTNNAAVTVSPTLTTTYTLTVSNTAGSFVTKTAIVTVVPAPAITSFTPALATIVSGNTTTLTALFSGGTGSVNNGVGAVTTGTPVNISPTTTTTYTLTVTNTATTPASVTAMTTVTVDVPPAITTANNTTFTIGSAGTFTVVSTGNPTAALNAVGALPGTVAFHDNGNGTATISGTATGSPGSYPITITANNGVSPNAVQSFTLNTVLVQAPAITSANSVTFTAGANGTFTVTTTGSPAPALAKTGALPSGVNFTDNGNGTATISGSAAAAGSSSITITASNGTLPNATQTFTFNVVAAPVITGFTAAAPTITAGGSTTLTGVFTGGTGSVNNSVGAVTTGALAPVSPTVTTTYTLTVTNAATTPASVTAMATVTVVAAPVITSFIGTTTIVSGNSTTITPTFSNGTGSISPTVGAVTSGTGYSVSPTTTTTYTLTVTNTAGGKLTSTVTITVNVPPQITSANGATFTVGVSGSFTVTTTGTLPMTLTETGSLPSPITFVDNGNGTATISGKPTGASVSPITITASNGFGSNATQTFTLSVTAVSCSTNCTISGTVSFPGTLSGPPISGVTITLSGPSSPSTTTLANGSYSFTGLTGGTYTVTPSLAGYTFSPSIASVTTTSTTTVQNFTELATAGSFSITGSLTYSGALTGSHRTYIRVYAQNSGCTGNCGGAAAGTSLASEPSSTGTSYTVNGLPNGTYFVVAEIDGLNNGSPNASNPWGQSSTFTVSGANYTVPTLALNDQTTSTIPALVAPSGVTAAGGSTFVLVQYNQNNSSGLQDSNGREIATSYKVYYNTSNSFPSSTYVAFAAHGNHDNNLIVSGLTNGTTYYFAVSMLNVHGEVISSTTTPVTATPHVGTGTYKVTGSISWTPTTVAATGPLYVGLLDSKNGVIYGEEVPLASVTNPYTYTITGVPIGNYQEFAIVDQNKTGLIGPSDISNVNNNQGGPPALSVTISSPSTITNNIAMISAPSTIDIITSHQQLNGGNDTYSLNLGISWGSLRPVAMTLTSGNNVQLPWDMPVDSNNSENVNLNGAIPKNGDIYSFQVTLYNPATQAITTQTLTGTVTLLNSFVTSMQVNTPVNSASSTPATVPMFNWVTPSSLTLPSPYTYYVGLYSTNGSANVNWQDNGGKNSSGLPAGTVNLQFDADGSATSNGNPITALSAGTTYQWYVGVYDSNGNSAQEATTYTTPGTPSPSVAPYFVSSSIPVNGFTTLVFNITNPSGSSAMSGIAFTDNMTGGLSMTGVIQFNSCSGSVIETNSTVLNYSGGSLAAGATCNFGVNVTDTAQETNNNIATNITDTGNTTGTSSSTATLTVFSGVAAPVVNAYFPNPGTMTAGQTTTLNFNIYNNNGGTTTLSSIGFSDSFAGSSLLITQVSGNTVAYSNCSGTIIATNGTSSLSLSGASLSPGATCSFGVNVTDATPETVNTTPTGITSTPSGIGGGGTTATLTVNPATPIVSASAPFPIFAGNPATTINISVTNDLANDTLTPSLTVDGNTTFNCTAATCGTIGTISGVAGSGNYTLSYTPPASTAGFTQTYPTLIVSSTLSGSVAANTALEVDPAGILVSLDGIDPFGTTGQIQVVGSAAQTMTLMIYNDTTHAGVTYLPLTGSGYACASLSTNSCGSLAQSATTYVGNTGTATITHTAPVTLPGAPYGVPRVQAISVADPTRSASEAYLLSNPVTPLTIRFNSKFNSEFAGGAASTVTAKVVGDTGSSQTVNWTLMAGGSVCSPACGTLGTATVGVNGTNVTSSISYTPPSSLPTVTADLTPTITATSVDNSAATDSFSFVIADGTCGTGHESVLNGQYAFLLRGSASPRGHLALIGSFTATGAGGITGGLIDTNQNTGPVLGLTILSAPTGSLPASSYSVGSDNRGCLTLSDSGGGEQTFRFALGTVVSGVATQGAIIRFDDNSSFRNRRQSGVLLKQTPASFNAAGFSGTYAFGEEGVESNGSRLSVAGLVTSNGAGSLSNLSFDTADASGPGNGSGGSGSSVLVTNAPGGRGTFTTNVTTNGGPTTTHSVLYIVSASEALFMSTDPLGSNNPIISGDAKKQSGSFTQTSLDNHGYVIYVSGIDPANGGNNIGIGQAAFPASANGVATLTFDQNDNGVDQAESTSPGQGFTIGSNGRTTIAGGGGKNPIIYLVDPTQGFVVGTDSNAFSGYFQRQTPASGTFSTSTVSGAFFAGLGAPNTSADFASGILNFASAAATGTVDVASGQGSGLNSNTALPQNGNSPAYTVSSTLGQVLSHHSIGYIVSPSKVLELQTNGSPGLLTFQQ